MPLPIVDIIDFLKNKLSFRDNQNLKLNLSYLEFKSGNISLYELFCICSIVKVLEPNLVMEFGTFDGRTTINIANNLPINGKIITVDLPFPDKPEGTPVKLKTKFRLADGIEDKNDELGFVGVPKLFENHMYKTSGKIQQIWSDTAMIDPINSKWKNKVDLFFIDASHTYENCYNDSKIAYQIIKQYGIIIWHDYNGWPGVTKALDQIGTDASEFIKPVQIKDTSLAVGIVTFKGEI